MIGGGSNVGSMIGISAPRIVTAITAVNISPAIGRIVAAITVVSASVAVRIAISIRVTRVGIIVVIIVAAVSDPLSKGITSKDTQEFTTLDDDEPEDIERVRKNEEGKTD